MITRFENKLDRARRILRDAGPLGAYIKETTPKHGGLRSNVVEKLVRSGEAKWIRKGFYARIVEVEEGQGLEGDSK